MSLDELRDDLVLKQKKGLPFICASVVIWLLILIVILLDLPQLTENFFVFCCSETGLSRCKHVCTAAKGPRSQRVS